MAATGSKMFKMCAEFLDRDKIELIPPKTRGVYVLFRRKGKRHPNKYRNAYEVVYVGMTTTATGGRIKAHARSEKKSWTHFSFFEVKPSVKDEVIKDLEGLLRHIYRQDPRANRFNVARTYSKLKTVRVEEEELERPRARAKKKR